MLQLETRLGDYEILDLVQNSRKETVYRVRNLVANRIEAMKLLPDSLQDDEVARERFFREIKVMARLVHPNIVTFYHATQLNGRLVMTTELLDGVTLAERFTRGSMAFPEVLSVVKQVMTALAHAHSNGVVHREVTPENIWILADGRVKLGGFGLAKPKGDMNLTQEGTSLGEVHYMAPEQVKGLATVDARADIYAAGCTLYEMLAGKKPFEAKSQFDVMLAHVQRHATPITLLNSQVPAAVHGVLEKAMAKEPAERYGSALAFLDALVPALEGREALPPARRSVPVELPPPVHTPARAVVLPEMYIPAATPAPRMEERLLPWLIGATGVMTIAWLAWQFLK